MSTTNENALGRPVPGIVDWLVGPLLAVIGLLAAAAGYLIADVADREWADLVVGEMTVQSSFVSRAELVEVIYNLTLWGGRGLVATGVLVAVVGVAFFVYRRRVRGREGASPDAITTAVIGAVVTTLAVMVPLSPLLGGGVAGYFGGRDRRSGTVHGAYAGLLTAVPVGVLTGFLLWGALAASAPMIGLVILGSVAFSVLYTVGLSAAGGYLGVALTED